MLVQSPCVYFRLDNPNEAAHVAVDLQCRYTEKYEYNRTHGSPTKKNSLKLSVAIKAQKQAETQTECMHCIPSFSCTVYPAKVGIKNACTQFVFHLSCLFQCLLESLLTYKNSKVFLKSVRAYFLVMQMYSYMHVIENMG